MPTFNSELVSVDDLLLDPNNYRLHDTDGHVTAAENRFHEESVQQKVWHRLKLDGISELKNSIVANGFFPTEPVVAKRYVHSEGKFVVIEGNRRLASLKWIKSDIDAGMEVDPSVRDMLTEIPTVVVSHDEDNPAFFETLMGVRHISGIKQWGGYQRAKLVVTLRDVRGLNAQEIADRVGMSTREVNRRYKAFKALDQMRESDDYGDFAGPQMYALYHEAISVPHVRSWLEWNEDTFEFENDENVRIFYSMVSPTEDNGKVIPPKIDSYSEVREMGTILVNEEAKASLIGSSQVFCRSVCNRQGRTT